MKTEIGTDVRHDDQRRGGGAGSRSAARRTRARPPARSRACARRAATGPPGRRSLLTIFSETRFSISTSTSTTIRIRQNAALREFDVQREQPDAAQHDDVGELELHPDRPARIARAELLVRVAQGTPEHGPADCAGATRRRPQRPRPRWARAAAAWTSSRGPTSTAARPSSRCGISSRPCGSRADARAPGPLDGLRSSRFTFAGIAV